MVKPAHSDPPWMKQSLRRLGWQALIAWLATTAIAIVVVVGVASLRHNEPEWMLVLLLPQIFLFRWIRLAYRRGVRDSEEHPRNASDATPPTI